ncbi:hypothetical protein F4813DRAFT_390985 [Daldinia decipiens]|uniref:uncharacterized protein n=1 Tax=Daldinia decipiens TaxID=326647 RepID=UPI0020C265E3|nr:uncharacterized protein F4813DRAFT_390985 [Daldinia decipiens]KAI1656001.1 hypothetical protein F4813DRAFT_390985 [Daldinia decipiens]
MKFASIVTLALPAVALAQTSTPAVSDTPAPSGSPDLSICEKQAGSYADACPRCNPNPNAGNTVVTTAGNWLLTKFAAERTAILDE